ncbi:adenylate kinase isoenzyme 1-like [Ooceraea biroi]|nr:adenylate kinase isoenzyme 1-like [Ooceraea biroi]
MGINCVRGVDPLGATIPRSNKLDPSPIIESRLPIIFLIGGPGAGKKTQCTQITKHYGFCGIVTRDLLRDEVATGSQRGVILAYLMSEGKLVPSNVLVELIKVKMLNNLSGTRGFLICGFPKEKLQCKHFDKYIQPLDLVLYLWVRNSVLMDRILARTVTATERLERNFDEIKRRIKEFVKMNKPILRYYRKKLIVIDGEKEKSEVFNDICNAIDQVLGNFPSTSMTKAANK